MPGEVTPPANADELELRDHEREIEQMIARAPVPLCRNAAKSAINYLRRAWRIRAIDPPLAMFCCITAEEEAVRAVMHALQRHGYAGADRLRWWNHRQKAVVIPFLQAIGVALDGMPVSIVVNRDGVVPQLRTRWLVQAPNGETLETYPVPPLNAQMRINGQEPDVTEDLVKLFEVDDFSGLRKVLRARANDRNEWLYASEKGLPGVAGSIEPEIRRYKANVFALLMFFLLIDEHAEVQGLAQQTLAAFLRVHDTLYAGRGERSESP
jgi:hypothetical protein